MMSIFYQHNILMVNFGNQPVNHIKQNGKIVWLQRDDRIQGLNILEANEDFPNLPDGYLYPTDEILTKIQALSVTNYTIEPSFVVAKIMEREDIPGTHLHKCMVDTGSSEWQQIVCGADNARAGLTTVCALTGTTMPDGTIIQPGSLMGIPSHGMLCSAKELNLQRDEPGILELKDGLKPGLRFDPVFKNLGNEEGFFNH